MRFIGIDYSTTTPAITAMDKDGNTDTYFLTGVRRHTGAHAYGGAHGRTHAWIGYDYPDYVCQEHRFHQIAEWSMKIVKPDDVIMIEDYAFASKGRVFHIAENCGLLKHKLWAAGYRYETVTPSTLKKFATGKGNADKCMMHDAFVAETGIDVMKAMDMKGKDCGSPVSDIVDSFYLARYAFTRQSHS